ncbi:MAG: hypothetical protein KDA96_16955 [Planctomycetaceae bacterium]|nr:hypothetical protein [Planctomycetaceae bacterium]
MKLFLLSIFGVLFVVGMPAHAQDSKSDSADSVESISGQRFIELLKSHYHKHSSAYVFGSGDDQSRPFRMEEKPILTWTSTGDALWSGDVFVWTSDGRPQVIGCVGSWPIDDSTRGIFEELHSLSTQPLAETALDSSLKWRSETAGVELKDIPDTTAPANDTRRRLSQMRRLTDRFKASMAINNGTEELRLLTQPLYRYSGESEAVIDGAIFAYVTTTGTDPEVLLLLECHKTEDKLKWVYAPARFTHRELWLTLDDSEVWRVANHQTPYNNAVITDPYLSRPTDPVSIDDLH